MEIAGVVFALIMLFVMTFVVIAVVRAARAVGRGVERAGEQVRRGIDETSIRVRAAQPGAVGQAARLRLELRGSVDTARAELTASARQDSSLREALTLLDQLHDHARVLDRELGALTEREPDRVRIAERLPELRERAQEIRQSADALRFAAQDRARRHHSEGLAALREQIDIETGALRHWTPADSDSGTASGGTTNTTKTTSGGTTKDGRGLGDGSAAREGAASPAGEAGGSGGSGRAHDRGALSPPRREQLAAEARDLWNQLPGMSRNRRTRDVS
ncbi:hypothetical protein GL263_07090 [Streptomyces durbertensis]|uniref:Secreted protein n=1 Tax=Streptomyces durbertensis TaxID=2448886 RepID=A0ABR6EEE5_9ACTN|nr:hypothetical protein [Streptomyces durbertensis]MBB1243330.1 hypothetical protein [Streptomyces durbertensis]